jgi:hypothetical protein
MKKHLLLIAFILLFGMTRSVKAQTLDYYYNIYQYYNAAGGIHFYTNNYNELGGGLIGYTYEKIMCKLYNSKSTPYQTAVYRFVDPKRGSHYYTTVVNMFPDGYQLESILGYTPPSPVIPKKIYEFYNAAHHDYYYSDNQTPPSGYVYNKFVFNAF